MALTSNDETDLLLPLMQSHADETPFATFLERLLRRTRARLAGVAMLDAKTSTFRRCERGNSVADTLPEEQPLALERAKLEALRPNRVYAIEELLDISPLARTQFFRTFAALGLHDARIIRLGETSGTQAWLYLARDTDSTASDSALLSALAPYLAAATAQMLAGEQLAHNTRLTAKALAQTGWAWRLPGSGVQIESGEATALEDAQGGETLLVPLEPGNPDAALLLSQEGEIDLARAARRLAALHGLPPREAQLAAAMAAGQSIAEAGAAMGLTLETARNYSKRIYARLGVSGQPALCAKVWRGVAMLP